MFEMRVVVLLTRGKLAKLEVISILNMGSRSSDDIIFITPVLAGRQTIRIV